MRAIKGYLDSWRIQEYLLITFFISWLSWGILILLTGFHIVKFQSVVGTILFLLGGFGPTISAIMCIEGKIGFKKVWKFIVAHKKRTIRYFLLFVALMIAVAVWSNLASDAPLVSDASMMQWTLTLIGTFLFSTLLSGGNEELGWRGTLQPLMEKVTRQKIKNKFLSFVVTTLSIGLIWALWHLPLWFVEGCMQQSINYGIFVIECLMLSFILGCIYRKTHSVLYCMIIHGLANLLLGALLVEVNLIFIVGFIIITVLAVLIGGFDLPSSELMLTEKVKKDDASS